MGHPSWHDALAYPSTQARVTWKPRLPRHQLRSSVGGMSITETMSPTWEQEGNWREGQKGQGKWGAPLESASAQPHLEGQLIWCLGCVPFDHVRSGHRGDVKGSLLTEEQSPAVVVQLRWGEARRRG